MTTIFNPRGTFIPVTVQVRGPRGITSAILALDTGATMTWLSVVIMAELGYDLASPADLMEVTTASSREVTPVIPVAQIRALNNERLDFPVLCHNLPSGTPFDGLLGLDFFRDHRLTIDFREGLVTLD